MAARILIIAGSDSGGGAGVQGDVKTVTMLGGHAMTAITAVTAQNTKGVTAVHPVPTETVMAQIDAVIGDIGVDAVKIGMIGSPFTALHIAARLEALEGVPIVFDPVMVATSGSVLADAATIAAFEPLMRLATLTTPNLPELSLLTGEAIESMDDVSGSAESLSRRYGCAVLAKGGHGEGPLICDVLIDLSTRAVSFEDERIDTRHTHGTGCTLSSAIATLLGHGQSLEHSVRLARQFVRKALATAPGFGSGHGPMGHQAVR